MKLPRSLILCLFASLFSGPLWALPSDRQQAIRIESDSATRNDKTGTTVYTGSVSIRQGSMHISANKVTVHTRQQKIDRVVCIGTPAVYRQRPKKEGELMTARGNTIEYQLAKETLVLTGNASVDQGGSEIKGPVINYDLKRELMQAGGEGRVQMVIPPSQQVESTR